MKVLIYGQILKDNDKPYVSQLISSAEKEGLTLAFFAPYLDDLKKAGIVQKEYETYAGYEDIKSDPPELVVTLGGDGTILGAILHIRDTGVPILGVNLGRLGFLSNIEKSKIEEAVKIIANREYSIEERTMLRLKSNLPLFGETPYCLNDFTLHKRDTSSMVNIHAYVDGKFLNSYWADGIVVSTPTGSTGYSLSVGGPIVFPNSGNFVIAPVAPHNLNVRPIVLSDSSEIMFRIEGRSENFLCTLDSRYETITSEHELTISRCDFKISLARHASNSFMKTIRNKLLWGLDKRN